jgi:hypothetical protein
MLRCDPKDTCSLLAHLGRLRKGMSRQEVFAIVGLEMVPALELFGSQTYAYPAFQKSEYYLAVTFEADAFDEAVIYDQNGGTRETWPKFAEPGTAPNGGRATSSDDAERPQGRHR